MISLFLSEHPLNIWLAFWAMCDPSYPSLTDYTTYRYFSAHRKWKTSHATKYHLVAQKSMYRQSVGRAKLQEAQGDRLRWYSYEMLILAIVQRRRLQYKLLVVLYALRFVLSS